LPRGCVKKVLEVAKYSLLFLGTLRKQKKPLLNLLGNWSNEAVKGLYFLDCLEGVENCVATTSSVATHAKVDKNDTTPQLPRGCRKVPPFSVAVRKYYFLGCHEKVEKSFPRHFMLNQ
jgi:hypothetical protein